MIINRYEVGDLVRASGPFRNSETGSAIDPTAVFFSYRNPSGTVTTLTYGVDAAVVKDSVGNYHSDINANASGRWFYRWHSTGLGQAADWREFYVKPDPFT